jgi:hypothetical protein
MGRTDVRGGVSWERSDRSIICRGCGAICVKPGWFERAVNSLYGQPYPEAVLEPVISYVSGLGDLPEYFL